MPEEMGFVHSEMVDQRRPFHRAPGAIEQFVVITLELGVAGFAHAAAQPGYQEWLALGRHGNARARLEQAHPALELGVIHLRMRQGLRHLAHCHRHAALRSLPLFLTKIDPSVSPAA